LCILRENNFQNVSSDIEINPKTQNAQRVILIYFYVELTLN